ncbi:MAG: hypothetical protein U9O97_01620, partial [Elusimicrobiota bacterium]|nr:hypothetical protein [Elusimicrobiota bacterium]
GLTQLFPELPRFAGLLHGELVGVGILACLFALRRIDELVMLRKLFSDIDIFEQFRACGKLTAENFKTASEFAVKNEKQFRKLKIKASDLTSALCSLEINTCASERMFPGM